ncbi:unnamed protein product [Allacma fusca]|uniref:Uncharacterized protein n=1 Tax=Allacma fusca TaxID=39272 RepID=A0A8J2MGD0_9HEXA|nr:unnamed protein product [Allacma fusca]
MDKSTINSFLILFLTVWITGENVYTLESKPFLFSSCISKPPQSLIASKCSIKSSNKLKLLSSTADLANGAQCLPTERNAFLVRGDYGVITINCTATYPLDFDYDGFRPTEAIHVRYWKSVSINDTNIGRKQSNVSILLHGITITVESIVTLYERYLNFLNTSNVLELYNARSKDMKISPTTGRFTIHELKGTVNSEITPSSINTSFYFFLEENLHNDKVTFMDNQHTKIKQVETSVIIPCRPSHYLHEDTVMLETTPPISIQTSIFNPTIGFTVTGIMDINKTIFECIVLKDGREMRQDSKQFSVQTDSQKNIVYGLETLHSKPDRKISPKSDVHITPNDFYVWLRCTYSNVPTKGYTVLGVGIDSPAGYRYAREFALPAFANKSYFVKATDRQKHSESKNEYPIEHSYPWGAFLCADDQGYVFTEYWAGLDSQIRFLPAGHVWNSIGFNKFPEQVFLNLSLLNQTGKLYNNQPLRFLCRLNQIVMTPPVIWSVTYRNGDTEHVHVDETCEGYKSEYTIALSKDAQSVTCSSYFYFGDLRKSLSLKVNITAGSAPEIVSTESISLNSRQVELRCRATGDPTPWVWWEKNNSVLSGSRQMGTSTFIIDAHDIEGAIYLCRSQNHYGSPRKEFSPSLNDPNNLRVILPVTFVVLAVLIIVTVAIYLYLQKKSASFVLLTLQEIKDFEQGIDPKLTGADEIASRPFAQPYRQEYEIPNWQFQIDNDNILGSGAFSVVKKGLAKGKEVAVKTVKPGADKSYLKALLSEIKILIYLGKHDNLIALVGACTSDLRKGIACVFVEFCELGDLLHYLQKYRESFLRGSSEDSLDDFSANTLHRWAIEISSGMAYLTEKKVIHGDLAARNILLNRNRTAKITDFGLSRQLYSYTMYMKQNQEPLPWRWMAIESLSDLKFSPQSDIWAFGVTIWEIYSLGQVPFPAMNWDVDFVQSLQDGLRMPCPDMAPNELYTTIMMACWRNDPESRPSFEALGNILMTRYKLAQLQDPSIVFKAGSTRPQNEYQIDSRR